MNDQRVTVVPRTSTSTGVQLFKINKPGYKFDFLLTEEQLEQLLDELERMGRI